jgi:solute:Na+ symporter, SSS family
MSILIIAVSLYLLSTVAIGLYASSRVKGSKDFMVAGRSLPLYMNFACVFATWFGAETLLSISATFVNEGLTGVSGDPFGAAMCLGIVAIFFARAFYRMDLLTIGDFYHKRFGKFVEVLTSVAITISYLGWTSAQMTALGLVLWVLGGDYFGQGLDGLNYAIIMGSVIVFIYTVFGGMWSVALTDVIQTAAIVIGLIIVAAILSSEAGGVSKVIEAANAAGKFQFFPSGEDANAAKWWTFIAAFLTFGLGSIPQQDVFQRVTSAKNERTAVFGTLLGGTFYFFFAFIPMLIAYSAIVIAPDVYLPLFEGKEVPASIASAETGAESQSSNSTKAAELDDAAAMRKSQRILPDLILNRTPIWCQILFFGALLSAILSTASGTLLAPSSLFTENVLRPFVGHMDDKVMLWTMRFVMAFFALAATLFALNTNGTMYQMVQNAYKVTLTMAFVPLAFGVYWTRATTQGAICSALLGLAGWLSAEYLCGQNWGERGVSEMETPFLWHLTVIPPQMYGLATSILGMIVGSLAPQVIRQAAVDEDALKRTSSVVGH